MKRERYLFPEEFFVLSIFYYLVCLGLFKEKLE